jgi:protein-S-isoprenylcysteine O-methyltransferase Ste14
MAMVRLLAYGLFAYGVFGLAFLYAIGFATGIAVPTTMDKGMTAPAGLAALIDCLLLLVFALQHSVMARKSFKRWWTKFVPRPVERSTYVLVSSLALALIFWQWRPIPMVVWHIGNQALAFALTAFSVLGFLIVAGSSFLISHFELLGLTQVGQFALGYQPRTAKLATPLLYRLVRHPLYLGFILAFWCTPTMTAGHLLFAAVTTLYILVGIALEERDLIAQFGEEYRNYRRRVPMLIPWRKPL